MHTFPLRGTGDDNARVAISTHYIQILVSKYHGGGVHYPRSPGIVKRETFQCPRQLPGQLSEGIYFLSTHQCDIQLQV